MFLKVIFSFLSFIVIYVLVTTTFSSSIDSENFIKYSNTRNNGVFSLSSTSTGFTIQDIKKNNQNEGFFIEKFNKIDTILFSNKNTYSKKESGENISISLNKGKYFFFLADDKKYEISGVGYKISVNGPIKFYINSTDDSYIDVLPMDNVLHLDLTDTETKQLKTKVYLFPHMYFTFKPSLNKILEGADLLRVSQVNNIFYIEDSFYNLGDNFYTENTSFDNKFFKDSLIYFNDEYKITQSNITYLVKNNTFSIPGQDYIKKYTSFFVNDNKKIAYLKDQIFSDLIKIFDDSYDKVDFINLKANLSDLEILDKKSFNSMLENDINFFKYNLLFNYNLNLDSEKKKKDFYNMIGLISKKSYSSIELKLFDLSNSYDLGEKDLFFDGLSFYAMDFLNKNGVKMDNLDLKDTSKNFLLEYYSYYLRNIILNSLKNEEIQIKDLNKILLILKQYSLVSYKVYSNGSDNKVKTGIYFNMYLMEKFNYLLRNYFFEKDLKDDILLQIKVKLSPGSLSNLKDGYDILIKFFNQNKGVLDESVEKDKLYLTSYETISKDFLEYYEALNNYSDYKLKRNKLWASKIGKLDDIAYDTNFIADYLGKFQGVNKNNLIIRTNDNKTFNITNLVIGDHILSFDLSPYNYFYINNVILDGNKKTVSYKLSLIEDDRAKILDSVPLTDIEKINSYKFSNFFINTFLKDGKQTIQNDEQNNSSKEPIKVVQGENDRVILVYKRDNLILNPLVFGKMTDFFKVKLDDIIIKKENDDYNISIDGSEAFFSYDDGNGGNYLVDFLIKTDFIYDRIDGKNHIFQNLKFKVFKKVIENGNSFEEYGIGNNYINYIGKLGIGEFKNYIYNISQSYNDLSSIYGLIPKNLGEVKIDSFRTGGIKFIFGNYELLYYKNKIRSIKKDGVDKLNSPLEYYDFSKINLFIN